MGKTRRNKKKSGWFKKAFRFFLFLGIALGIAVFAINIHIKSYSKDMILTAEECENLNADCILVLGAGLWDENTPSFMLADRVRTGIKLYELGASNRLLMSGDHGQNNHDEVGVMREYALKRDIPSEDIFLDHAGFSTYESMYRAKYIFGAKKIIIVTQEFHISRAIYIANKLGIEAYGVTSNLHDYKGNWYNILRETLARVKDFFMIIVKPKPTFLGDMIPLTGSGEITLG